MKSSNVEKLNRCPTCFAKDVFASYEENKVYKYKCNKCGQFFKFNASSQAQADFMFNKISKVKFIV